MGSIFFQGGRPFELETRKPPTASARGERVFVTLPVFVGGGPRHTLELQIRLSFKHAEQLLTELETAVHLVRSQIRNQG